MSNIKCHPSTLLRAGMSNIVKPYFLYVGAAYPHKNLENLLKAFRPFINHYQLVLVGRQDYFYQRLKKEAQEMGLEKKLSLLDILMIKL